MMTGSQAFVPSFIDRFENKLALNVLAIFGGVILISLMAQVAIPLPWTPVPITGQTFAVTLVSLLWGAQRGALIMVTYLAIGYVGFPVFAFGKTGAAIGATFGYLVGMLLSAYIVGSFVDRGWAKSFSRILGLSYLGSFITFSFGLWGLSFFLPGKVLLAAGLFPFLLGDLIKNMLASLIVWKLR